MRRLDSRQGGAARQLRRLAATWVALIALGAAEFAASFLHMDSSLRPLIMIPGIAMIVLVAVVFMEVGKGPVIVRAFAVAAMFWLVVLLGLGSVDALTRTDHYISRVLSVAEH